jgi:pilus assembly protein Flp/PilA
MSPRKIRLDVGRRSEEGQAMVEYALILALITVVSLAMLTLMGENVQAMLQAVADILSEAAAGL